MLSVILLASAFAQDQTHAEVPPEATEGEEEEEEEQGGDETGEGAPPPAEAPPEPLPPPALAAPAPPPPVAPGPVGPAPAPPAAPDGWRSAAEGPAPYLHGQGRMIVVGYAGGALAVDSALLAYALGADPGAAVPVGLAGGLLGVGLALPLTSGRSISEEGAVFVTSTGAVGLWTGVEAGRLVIRPGAELEPQRIAAAGALGNLIGSGTGLLLARNAPSTASSLGLGVGTAVGWQAGAGIANLAGVEDRQAQAGMELALGLALGAASAPLWGNIAELPAPEQVVLNLGHAAWFGAWTPFLFSDSPDSELVLGGMRIGLAGGYGATLAMAQLPHSRGTVPLQAAGFAMGTSLGAGVPLAFDSSDPPRLVVAPMLIGGLAGQAIGYAVAPHWRLDGGDGLFFALTEVWAGYQALGWGLYGTTSNASEQQAVGFGLTAFGLTSLAAFAVPTVTDFDPPTAVMAASGGLWGTWYGGWTAEILDLGERDGGAVVAAALIGGDLALIGTTAAIAGTGWEPSWAQTGVVHGSGLAGAATGALVGVLVSPEIDNVGVGALAGSTVGLVGGVVLARNMGGSTAAGPRLGALAKLPVSLIPSAGPWRDEAGRPGAMLRLDVLER